MADGFIVVYDDEMGVCLPMGWSGEAEGALSGAGSSVALFKTRAEARKAIAVSRALARLHQAQGKPVNEDWMPSSAKCIKVLPLKGGGNG